MSIELYDDRYIVCLYVNVSEVLDLMWNFNVQINNNAVQVLRFIQ